MTTRKKTKMAKDARGKVRGGSSYPCPRCGGVTHVRTTRRTENNNVARNRQCLSCDHVFDTHERADTGAARAPEARAASTTKVVKKTRRVGS